MSKAVQTATLLGNTAAIQELIASAGGRYVTVSTEAYRAMLTHDEPAMLPWFWQHAHALLQSDDTIAKKVYQDIKRLNTPRVMRAFSKPPQVSSL